jgi:hypothetical protein
VTDNQSINGNGGGIRNISGETHIFNGVIISNNEATLNGGGIYNDSGRVFVEHSILSNNSASVGGAWKVRAVLPGVTNRITDSCIVNNSDTAVVNDNVPFDAMGNWWGASNGPGPLGPGAGDTVGEGISFEPFLTAPPAGLDCPGRNSTLAGIVYIDNNDNGVSDAGELGITGVTITLAGTDDLGDVNQTVITAIDGSYKFEIRSGTYSLAEMQPAGYLDGQDSVGSLGGTLDNDSITAIHVNSGEQGTGYNFGEHQLGLSINDVTITEGNSGTVTALFTVTLVPAASQETTVDYATADDTATVTGSDYVAASGTLTFDPGVVTQTIAVTVNGDTLDEGNGEQFVVNLANPTNTTIQRGQGIGTIADDDGLEGEPSTEDHMRAQAPLLSLLGGGTSPIVRSDVPEGTVTDGSVFGRIIAQSSEFVIGPEQIGNPDVIALGVIHAVDVFGLRYDGEPEAHFNAAVKVCLLGTGRLFYLDATTSPRALSQLPVSSEFGYTCGLIFNAGTVVLVP